MNLSDLIDLNDLSDLTGSTLNSSLSLSRDYLATTYGVPLRHQPIRPNTSPRQAPTSPVNPVERRPPRHSGTHSTRLNDCAFGRSFPLQLLRLYLVLSILERTTPTTSTTAPPPQTKPNPPHQIHYHQIHYTNPQTLKPRAKRSASAGIALSIFILEYPWGVLCGGLLTALNQRRSKVTSGPNRTSDRRPTCRKWILYPPFLIMQQCLVASLVLTSHWIGSCSLSTTAGLCLNILFHFPLLFLTPASACRLDSTLHIGITFLPYLPKRLYHNISLLTFLTYISAHSLSSSSFMPPPLPLLTPSSS